MTVWRLVEEETPCLAELGDILIGIWANQFENKDSVDQNNCTAINLK